MYKVHNQEKVTDGASRTGEKVTARLDFDLCLNEWAEKGSSLISI